MPAALDCCTHNFILSLLSKAVLAAVVTQTPRMALGSQTGVGGVVGGVVGGGVGETPFLPQAMFKRQKLSRKMKNNLIFNNWKPKANELK
jgi:hypothetical protein